MSTLAEINEFLDDTDFAFSYADLPFLKAKTRHKKIVEVMHMNPDKLTYFTLVNEEIIVTSEAIKTPDEVLGFEEC